MDRSPVTAKKFAVSLIDTKLSSICLKKLTWTATTPILCGNIWRKSRAVCSATSSSGISQSSSSTKKAKSSNVTGLTWILASWRRTSRNTFNTSRLTSLHRCHMSRNKTRTWTKKFFDFVSTLVTYRDFACIHFIKFVAFLSATRFPFPNLYNEFFLLYSDR